MTTSESIVYLLYSILGHNILGHFWPILGHFFVYFRSLWWKLSDIGEVHRGANSTIFVNLDSAQVVIDTM